MRNPIVNRPNNFIVSDTVSQVDRQAEKFFVWEKHPRQKNNDYKKQLHSPILFL